MEQDVNNLTLDYIFSHMDDAVLVTDKTGVLKYTNKAASDLLGIALEKNETRKIWQVIPFVERNDALIQLFLDAVRPPYASQQALTEYENNFGKVFNFRVSLTYTPEEGGMFIVVINDLTDFLKVSAAFSRYTSPQIAEYVLSTPEGEKRGGQAREITVLMSDLRGSTALSEALDPEALITVLNHYFEAMVLVIEECRGCVIEFLGDGIFVVFGAPEDDPDHADHAVSCAVRMQKAMEKVNAWNRENGYPDLEMGIGLHTGKAVVGNIGSASKMKYGCIGEPVNMAGRTEGCTVGGQVLITDNTLKMLTKEAEIVNTLTIMPKGGDEPLTLHDVTGYGDVRFSSAGARRWRTLLEPLPVTWRSIKDKCVGDTVLRGHFTALDENDRYALLLSEEELSPFQNILIDIGDGLYAKVTGRTGEKYTICFTAKPADYKQWAGTLRYKPD